MNYEEAMNYITSTAKFGSNLGLERTEKLLEVLGNPHKKIRCVHVAGTNGKGSTTAMITRILMEAGFKVGMYTSPYLEEFEERIQVNGVNIPKESLADVVSRVKDAVEEVIALGFDNPTEFEIITCAAFLYYYEQRVDFAVIEVGLGGRLDSTNVIHPILSVITSISYDHMKILGDTLSKIAYEKAGIIKENIPTVIGPLEDEALEVIEDIASKRHSRLIQANSSTALFLGIQDDGDNIYQRIQIKTNSDSYDVKLPLLGKHQIINCLEVIYAIQELINIGVNISKAHILKGLQKVKWIGRMEVMKRNPIVVIDGAHNIDGITRLNESIQTYFNYDNLVLILGILADKQVEKMVEKIVPAAKRVIAVTPNNSRAESSLKLLQVIKKYNKYAESEESYEAAYSNALRYCGSKDMLLICGSLYMIGDMRKVIKKHESI